MVVNCAKENSYNVFKEGWNLNLNGLDFVINQPQNKHVSSLIPPTYGAMIRTRTSKKVAGVNKSIYDTLKKFLSVFKTLTS